MTQPGYSINKTGWWAKRSQKLFPTPATLTLTGGTPTVPLPTVQFISAASAASNTVAMPTHQTGDLILVYAFRDGSTVQPTIPAGYTAHHDSAGTNTCSNVFASKTAASSSETTGTFTNATGIAIMVYRNALMPFFGYAGQEGAGSTITYAAIPGYSYDLDNPKSWGVRFAGHRTATNLTTNTPSGHTQRTGVATEVIASDLQNTTSTSTATQSVNASSGWSAITVELYPKTTATILSTATFSDNFTGTNGALPNSAKWNTSFAGGFATIDNNQLSFNAGASLLQSRNAFTFQGGQFNYQMISMGGTSSGTGTIGVSTPGWATFGGVYYGFLFTAGSNVVQPVFEGSAAGTTFGFSTTPYYRIRESGGTVYLEASGNGTSWTTYHSGAFNTFMRYCFVTVSTWGLLGPTWNCHADNFNL